MPHETEVRDEIARLPALRDEESFATRFLLDLHSRRPHLGRSLARIALLDDAEALRDGAAFLLLVAARDGEVPRSVRRPLLREAGEALLRMFRDPAHDDSRKYPAPTLLELCGVRLSRDDLERHFRDYPAIVRKMSSERFGSLPASVGSVADLLAEIGLLDADEPADVTEATLASALGCGEDALESNPPLGAAILLVTCAMAHEAGIGGEPVEEALDRAAATDTPVAAFLLGELAAWPNGAEMAERAARLSGQLSRRGVRPAPLECGELVRGSISVVDGVGSQDLNLFFRNPGREGPDRMGELDLLSVLLDEEWGIRDAFAVFGEGAAVEEGLAGMEESAGIEAFPCDLPLARSLVAEALAIHAGSGTTPPGRWLLFRSMLGTEPITAARRDLDLSACGLDRLPDEAGLAEGTGSLAAESPFEDWFHASDEAYRFIRTRVRRQDLKRYLAGEDPPAELVGEFNRLHSIRDRERIIRRLAVHLDLAARAGQSGSPRARRLARLYKELQSHAVPWHEIPFVAALGAEGVRSIAGNLAEGYRTQREADESAERESEGRNRFESGHEFEDELDEDPDDDETDSA